MGEHNRIEKIAVINDVTGFGKCGAMVSVPIISALGIQCCVVPTSIFSNHTAFDSYFMEDYTDRLGAYALEWKKLDLRFCGILTGFYGSGRQIDMVSRFIDSFFQEGTQVIVDPVMGDHGVRYATYTDEMCRKMGRLVAKADIITPNITESCILTDTKYQEHFDEAQLQEMCGRLHEMGPQRIVITGLDMEDGIGNYVSQNGQAELVVLKRRGKQRCGTGDIFASMIAAQAVKHVDFTESVRKAAEFIGMCIEESDRIGIPVTDGVCFEQFLGKLCE